MYEDKDVTYKLSINWKDLIIKILLLVLFIVLIVWLFPTKSNLNIFSDRIFNENIQTMKEAAKSYYTVDRLPSNIGESRTMTLKDMIESHMLIEFTDKDEKTCDTKDSYVQVTKTGDNEYALKVQLSCGKQKDYIIETIGCYDLCPDGSCEEIKVPIEETPVIATETAIEYQFKKAVPSTTTTYTCPSGYTKNGNKCTKDGNTSTINATVNYFEDSIGIEKAKTNTTGSYVVYADPLTKSGALTCPNGYTSNGTQCYKTYNASSSTTSGAYTCPAGYTLSGTQCYKIYSATYNSGSSSYSCPTGYSLSGSTCYKTYNATYKAGGTSYTCPYGSLSGTNCVYPASYKSGNTTYSCPNGGTLSGTQCIKYDYTSASASTTYGNWYQVTTYSGARRTTYTNETEKLVDNGITYKYTCSVISQCPVKAAYYNYTLYRRNKNTSYKCSTGTLTSDNRCQINKSYTATASTSKGSYSCPNGGSVNSSNNCVYAATKNSGSGSYSCPSGGTLNGSSCVINTSANKTSGNGSYSCPSGGTLSGTNCKITQNATKGNGSTVLSCPFGGTLSGSKCTTYTDGSKASEYYCPAGYTNSGSGASMTCSKKVTGTTKYYCDSANATLKGDKCYVKVKGGVSGYSCPNGYKLNGNKCTKKSTITINATAISTTTSTYTYKWSTSNTLDGWTATGKTRTVEINSYK